MLFSLNITNLQLLVMLSLLLCATLWNNALSVGIHHTVLSSFGAFTIPDRENYCHCS